MKSKKTKIKTVLLALFVAMSCVLGAGCGDDLTFEDGEYTAVLVAMPFAVSYVPSVSKVSIKNGELIIVDYVKYIKDGEEITESDNCGIPTKCIINKNQWHPDLDSRLYEGKKACNLEKLKNIRNCMEAKSSLGKNIYKYYLLLKCDDKIYLACGNKYSGLTSIAFLWELPPIS